MAKNKQEKLSFKETIFRRDNHRCLMCGNMYDPYFLILYFDTPGGKSTNNTDNIITLCRECERLLNEGTRWKDERGREISYRWNNEDIVSLSAKQKAVDRSKEFILTFIYLAKHSNNKEVGFKRLEVIKIETIPNEIYLAWTNKSFMEICSKLKEVKDCGLTEEALFNYMYEGLRSKRTFTFVSSGEDGKMNGCLVLTVGRDLVLGLALYRVFTWIDKLDSELWEKYMEFTENVAKEFKIKNIISRTRKGEKVTKRGLEKFGYKEECRIFVKNVV